MLTKVKPLIRNNNPMSTKDLVQCKCGATPIDAKPNKKKWRVMCPGCQRFYTRDKDTREEAVTAWNENIGSIGKKKSAGKVL